MLVATGGDLANPADRDRAWGDPMNLVAVAEKTAAPADGVDFPSTMESRPNLAELAPQDAAHRAPGEPDLLSVLAHDIRTPLSALLAVSELLQEDLDVLDTRQIRGMVSTIHRGTLALRGLTEDLLCATTIQAGRLSVHLQPLSVVDMLADVQPIVGPLLLQKRQQLVVSVRRPCATVSVDRRRIGQVLFNLIGNASKFSSAGQPIRVLVRHNGQWVRVAVMDRGTGVPNGEAARLFRPFCRAGAPAGTDGFGLGLSIVDAIVTAHGGRVGAANRRGGGATFWFELPVQAAVPGE
jgi:two-component system, OmpR family, sensor histidine kinase KdpD